MDTDGNLLVADTHYYRVLTYTPEGELLEEKTIGGNRGRAPGEFEFLTDVVVDQAGNRFVGEYGDFDRIQIFDSQGKYLNEFGSHGEGPGQFMRPQGMAIDGLGRLWVADACNHRLQVFDIDVRAKQPAELLMTLGSQGVDPGELRYPYGLVIDNDQQCVYVCEWGNHRIQKLSWQGDSLGTWGTAGKEVGQMHQPWGIADDGQGNLIVLDSYNNRVQRFEEILIRIANFRRLRHAENIAAPDEFEKATNYFEGGRPELMDSEKKHWVGFDLGGTKMLATVLNDELRVVSRERKRTKGHEGQQAGLDRIARGIRKALEEAEIEAADLAGIGIGCPGPLDLQAGVIHEAPNLGWRNVPVRQFLEDEFGCPARIVNDVDAGVFGEYCRGAAQNSRCAVGIFPGTGIGGGCVYEGQILQGLNCSCMEIGHIPMMSDGPRDGCGNRGTLESVASRLAISAGAAQAAYRGQAPHLREICGTDLSEIRSGALAESIEKGDQVVRQLVEDAAAHLGLAVVTIVHLLAPDTIVLGGGLVESMPDIFVKHVEQVARNRVLANYRDVFRIVAAELGDDATAVGAAAWARHRIGTA